MLLSIPTGAMPALVIGRTASYGTGSAELGHTAIAIGTSSSYGAWTQIVSGASVARDGVLLVSIVAVPGASELDFAYEFKVGIDPAGGTSYTDLISDFLFQPAPGSSSTDGITHSLPLRIPKGSSIAITGRTSKATVEVSNQRACVEVYDASAVPDALVCQRAEVVGRTGVGRGTTVTGSSGAWGSWTSLGTVSRNTRYIAPAANLYSATVVTGSNQVNVQIGSGDGSNYVPHVYGWLAGGVNNNRKYIPVGLHSMPVDLVAGTGLYARVYGLPAASTDVELQVLALG